MATPKLISKRISNCSLDINYSSLDNVIKMLTKERKQRTSEGWVELNIQMDGEPYDDSGREYPYLYGKRLETMDEAEAREDLEARRAAEQKNRDRAAFERLRKQFGDE